MGETMDDVKKTQTHKIEEANPRVGEPIASSKSDLNPLRLAENQIVADRYRVICLLGEGGMGSVYKVEQLYLKKEQALKTLGPGRLSDMAFRRFQKEAKAASLLDHPGLIKVQDFGLIDDRYPFFVMELAEGETLDAIIKKNGPLPLDMVLEIFRQACQALDYAHRKGVIHRDIKPSNIIISRYGKRIEMRVKIVDFGIAKRLNSDDPESLTRTGEIFGTPYYMSPEQCMGKTVDDRSDAYSVGCVLFEALTGLPPLIGDTALATMMKHQSETPPTLKEATLGAAFPQDLELVVAKMLEKNPRHRYRSLQDVITDLGRIADGEPVLLGGPASQPNLVSTNFEKPQQIFIAFLIMVLSGLSGYAIARMTETSKMIDTANQMRAKVLIAKGLENINYGPTALKTMPPPPESFSTPLPGTKWRLYHFGDKNLGVIDSINNFGNALVYHRGQFKRDELPVPLVGEVLLSDGFCIRANSLLAKNSNYFRAFKPAEIQGIDFQDTDDPEGHLTDDDLANLDHLYDLKVLREVNPNRLDERAIATINKFRELRNLALRAGKLRTSDLLKIDRLAHLTLLELHDFKQIDPLLEKMALDKNLVNLTLENCGIGHNLKILTANKKLITIDLNHNQIDNADLKCLFEFPTLSEASLEQCPNLTLTGLCSLKGLKIRALRLTHRSKTEEQILREKLAPIRIDFKDTNRMHLSEGDVDTMLPANLIKSEP